MACYEMIREIFNLCSGNQMRDVFVSEVETAALDGYVAELFKGSGALNWEKSDGAGGAVIFDIERDGLKERLTFTPA
ncbi:MAG: hypothetical protein LBD07_02900 [Spirochaetaceae bacterium]|nr:hypothetical protein [Spirochaetaceae bacterium]